MTDSDIAPCTEVTVIGFGKVGRTVAYLLGSWESPLRIHIVDPDLNPGSYADLLHSLGPSPHTLACNNDEFTRRAQTVFHCAGASVPPGGTRLDVAGASMEITESIFGGFRPLGTPLVLVLANPLDVITTQVLLLTGLPPDRVIGTGTLLDTYRLEAALAERLGCPKERLRAWVLGEHGDTMFAWASRASYDGAPLLATLDRTELEEILEQTRGSAAVIKSYQGATYYGVARCAFEIWRRYWACEPTTLPCSVLPEPSFRQRFQLPEVALSLPVALGGGAWRPAECTLDEGEAAALTQSAEAIRRSFRESWAGAR